MVTHSSTLAYIISWTEKPDRLQSMESQRVGLSDFTFMSNIASGNLLYKLRAHLHAPDDLDGLDGGRGFDKSLRERGYIYLHTADSFCCSA